MSTDLDETAVAAIDIPAERLAPEIIEKVVMGGDLSALNARDRVKYYDAVCRSIGLNPLTKPLAYLTLNNKLVLYALKDCTDQLRRLHNISIVITSREPIGEVYITTARASTPEGRTDESTGAVWIGNQKGEALANSYMKSESKAKRRATLSICGLGWLDETEVETLPRLDRPTPRSTALAPSTEPPTTVTPMPVTRPDPLRPETPVRASAKPTAPAVDELRRLLNEVYKDDAVATEKVRECLKIPVGQVTDARIRLQMTWAQYDQLKADAEATLREQIGDPEADVPDSPPPVPQDAPTPAEAVGVLADGPAFTTADVGTEAAPTDDIPDISVSDASRGGPEAITAPDSTDKQATPQQLTRLRTLAREVGDDAYADLQQTIANHGGGLATHVYVQIREKLFARQADQRNAAQEVVDA